MNMAAELSAADSAIEAASAGGGPRALAPRVEELICEADRNISRSGSFSSLSGDTSGRIYGWKRREGEGDRES